MIHEITLPSGEIYLSRYLHLRKGTPYAPGIAVGSTVSKGQLIGWMGNTGFSEGPHLHSEIHKGTTESHTTAINPADVFPVRQ